MQDASGMYDLDIQNSGCADCCFDSATMGYHFQLVSIALIAAGQEVSVRHRGVFAFAALFEQT